MIENTKKYRSKTNPDMFVDAIKFKLGCGMQDGFSREHTSKQDRPYIYASVSGRWRNVTVTEKDTIVYYKKKMKNGNVINHVIIMDTKQFNLHYERVREDARQTVGPEDPRSDIIPRTEKRKKSRKKEEPESNKEAE